MVSDRPVADVAEELAGALVVVLAEGVTVAVGDRGGLAAHQDKSTTGPSNSTYTGSSDGLFQVQSSE
jgi:hypothetical protein